MAGADPFKTGNTSSVLAWPRCWCRSKEFTWAAFIGTTAGCIVGIVMLPVALMRFGLPRMPNCERWWLGAASVLVISSNRAATLVVAGARHPHARAPDGDLARRPNGIPLDQVGTMGEAGRGQHCPAHGRKSVRACFFAGPLVDVLAVG
jgi:hypothetical protein